MSQDREFETYINGKSDLTDLYAGLPRVEPPGHLDAAILAEAHRAVRARPEGQRKRRWVMPLSMVASLFVAVMIGLQLPHLLKEPAVRQLPPQDRAAAETKDLAAAPAPAPLAEAQKPAPLASKKRAAGPVAPKAAFQEAQPAPAMQPAPASPLASAKAFEAAPAAPAPAEAAAERELTARRAVEADRESRSKQERSVLYPESNAGVARPVPPPAAVPAPAPAAQEAAAEQAPAAAPALESARENDGVASPRDWLARIRQLKQQGKLDEAGKELAAFRKRYPDYPIPKELER